MLEEPDLFDSGRCDSGTGGEPAEPGETNGERPGGDDALEGPLAPSDPGSGFASGSVLLLVLALVRNLVALANFAPSFPPATSFSGSLEVTQAIMTNAMATAAKMRMAGMWSSR